MDFFFQANNITDATMKRGIFLTTAGEETYQTVRSIFTPDSLGDVDFKKKLPLSMPSKHRMKN